MSKSVSRGSFSIPENTIIIDDSDEPSIGAIFGRTRRTSVLAGDKSRSIDDSKLEQLNKRTSFVSLEISRRRTRSVARNSDPKDEQVLIPANLQFKDKRVKDVKDDLEIVRFSKTKVWNSTSTLFVQSTMAKPDILRCIRCISALLEKKIAKKCKDPSPFDEDEETFSKRMHADKHAIYKFILNIYNDAQLTIECLIMALIYINRLLVQGDIKLTHRNLRPVILCGMMLASKVWDDTSMWNCDFCLIFPFFTIQDLNRWERKYLFAIGFDIFVSAKLYAEYYFDIREEEIKLNGGLETETFVKPLSREKAEQLEMISSRTLQSPTNLNSSRDRSNTSSDKLNSSSDRIILS